MWANAPAAVPHAIVGIAAVKVDVNLPLSPRAQPAIPYQSEPLHGTQSANMSKEKRKKETYRPLQQIRRETKGDGLSHEQDVSSCDILQLQGVEAVEGHTEVPCEVPQTRIRTRESQN